MERYIEGRDGTGWSYGANQHGDGPAWRWYARVFAASASQMTAVSAEDAEAQAIAYIRKHAEAQKTAAETVLAELAAVATEGAE